MPRIGMNPSRHQTSGYHPARVTVAVLTYLPNLTGYFRDRLEVMRLSLESLLAHTTVPYDLMVFDNASCPEWVEVLNMLNDQGKIRYLILSSENIGKIGALQVMFHAAPGEIIAYSDDDILFHPGWLEAHLEVIKAYPNVGTVSGLYIRTQMREGLETTFAFAEQDGVQARRGLLIPGEWERDYVANSGRTWEQYQAENTGLEDLELEYHGVKAYASAHHAQFVAPKAAILRALPDQWSGRLMGKVREVDLAINQLGYLRLSTHERVSELMGNVIDEALAAKARALGLQAQAAQVRKPAGLAQRLLRQPLVHRLAQAAYDRLYWVINA